MGSEICPILSCNGYENECRERRCAWFDAKAGVCSMKSIPDQLREFLEKMDLQT